MGMRRTSTLLFLLVGIVLLSPVQAQKELTAAEAKDHLDETAKVCGGVVGTRYTADTKYRMRRSIQGARWFEDWCRA
jgi:hypothetical protein